MDRMFGRNPSKSGLRRPAASSASSSSQSRRPVSPAPPSMSSASALPPSYTPGPYMDEDGDGSTLPVYQDPSHSVDEKAAVRAAAAQAKAEAEAEEAKAKAEAEAAAKAAAQKMETETKKAVEELRVPLVEHWHTGLTLRDTMINPRYSELGSRLREPSQLMEVQADQLIRHSFFYNLPDLARKEIRSKITMPSRQWFNSEQQTNISFETSNWDVPVPIAEDGYFNLIKSMVQLSSLTEYEHKSQSAGLSLVTRLLNVSKLPSQNAEDRSLSLDALCLHLARLELAKQSFVLWSKARKESSATWKPLLRPDIGKHPLMPKELKSLMMSACTVMPIYDSLANAAAEHSVIYFEEVTAAFKAFIRKGHAAGWDLTAEQHRAFGLECELSHEKA